MITIFKEKNDILENKISSMIVLPQYVLKPLPVFSFCYISTILPEAITIISVI